MRKLNFDESDLELKNPETRKNSFFLRKNIEKKKSFVKFTPTTLISHYKTIQLKSFTPMPEKSCYFSELGLSKARSLSNVFDQPSYMNGRIENIFLLIFF